MRSHKAGWIITGTLIAPSCVMLTAVNTFAWGPTRTTYTMANPAHSAVFNSITDNAAVGDERNFVRIAEKNPNATFTDYVNVQPGKQYEVYIYYHNDASATFNDAAHNYVGVARGTRLSSTFPNEIEAGQQGVVSATISSDTTNPDKVWDEAYMNADKKVKLYYVNGSARIYNDWKANKSVLPTSLFSQTGTFIGLDELDGLILGCDEFSGQVVYTIQAVGENDPEPDPPQPTPDPDPPTPTPIPDPTPEPTSDTPSEMPKTGPAEVIAATVIVLAIIAGSFYWYTTRKHLQKTTRAAAGRKQPVARRKSAARNISTTTRKTTRRAPVKKSAVKRAQRKRAVKKVVRKRK